MALIDTQRFIRTHFFFAARIAGTRILSCTRSPTPLSDVGAVDVGMNAIVMELRGLDRGEHDLLLDLRAEVPAENDDVQQHYRERRVELIQDFPRAAVLSTFSSERDHLTAAGERLRLEVRAFYDEQVAFRWLRG